MRPPSGANTALLTAPVWPSRMASGLPSRSHSRAVLSSEAVRMRPPSGANTALLTRSGVALEDGERLAVAVPQPRGVVAGGGQDAAAVGREHRAVTEPVWPPRIARSRCLRRAP